MRLHDLMIVCMALTLARGAPVRADNPPVPVLPAAAAAQGNAPAQRDAPVQQPGTEAPSATSATSTSAGAPPAQPADEPRQSTVDSAEDKHLRALGYTPEIHNGVTIYCKKEAPLGSRFEQKTCTTAVQHIKTRQNSKEMLEGAQRLQVNPAGH